MPHIDANRVAANSAAPVTKPGAVAPIAWSSFSTELRTQHPITVHSVLAPRRFDVHRLSDIAAWLDQAEAARASVLVVDLSEVRFIDQAALDAIDMLFSNQTVKVECVNPSPAFSLTARLVSQSQGAPVAALHSPVSASALSLSRRLDPLPQAPKSTPMTVAVGGDLTVANAHEFRGKLDDIVDDAESTTVRQPIVIDLSGVDRLDAAGLVAVTSAMLEMRRQGRCVSVIEPRQQKAVEFAKLTGVLPKLTSPTC